MGSIAHFLSDVNDQIDRYQAVEDSWERDGGSGYVPTQFDRLVEEGMDPEEAAAVVDLVDRCVEADRIARLGPDGAETMGLVMEINYGDRIPA